MGIDLYESRTMGGVIDNVSKVNTFFKDTFFKKERVFATNTIEFDITQRGVKIAPFVAPRIGGKVLERGGYRTKMYKPPFVAPKKILTADDVANRSAGEPLYNGKTPSDRAIKLVSEDVKELNDSILLREEMMCVELLFDGQITVKGDGVDEVIKLGDINKTVLVGTNTWDNPNSNPINDLREKRLEVNKSGLSPNIVIMSSKVADLFSKNKNVKELLNLKNYDAGLIKPEILETGATYWGFINELGVHIYSFDGMYADYDNINPEYPNVRTTDADFIPVYKSIVPENTLLMANTNMNAEILYASITDLKLGNEAINKKRVVKVWEEDEPSVRQIKVMSKPLPVIHNMDTFAIMEVFVNEEV